MRRFYKQVDVRAVDGGWQVMLDDRPLRTQGGTQQVVPTRALADALADEWRAQGEGLAASGFPLRDMTDYALDRVAAAPEAIVTAILPYGDTDTLCYRADEGSTLRQRQDEAWDPILHTIEARHAVTFAQASGIVHTPQPQATQEAMRAYLRTLDPFALTAVQNLSAIAGSLCIALYALDEGADIDAIFAASNLEEDWQAIQWGWDSDALARRDSRIAGFALAARLAALARQDG